jgi:hypothetical protein
MDNNNARFEEPTQLSDAATLALWKERRRALLGQVKALDVQRAALLQEANMIAKAIGPQLVVDNTPET